MSLLVEVDAGTANVQFSLRVTLFFALKKGSSCHAIDRRQSIQNLIKYSQFLFETFLCTSYRGADKSFARPGRKQATFPTF